MSSLEMTGGWVGWMTEMAGKIEECRNFFLASLLY